MFALHGRGSGEARLARARPSDAGPRTPRRAARPYRHHGAMDHAGPALARLLRALKRPGPVGRTIRRRRCCRAAPISRMPPRGTARTARTPAPSAARTPPTHRPHPSAAGAPRARPALAAAAAGLCGIDPARATRPTAPRRSRCTSTFEADRRRVERSVGANTLRDRETAAHRRPDRAAMRCKPRSGSVAARARSRRPQQPKA